MNLSYDLTDIGRIVIQHDVVVFDFVAVDSERIGLFRASSNMAIFIPVIDVSL